MHKVEYLLNIQFKILLIDVKSLIHEYLVKSNEGNVMMNFDFKKLLDSYGNDFYDILKYFVKMVMLILIH